MADLPSGMVTFLFTDIEGSTPLWEHEPDQMRLALARHHTILRTAIATQGGHAFKTIGDAFQAAFTLPVQAVAAALAAQRALATQTWETSEPIRVRMGLHVGPAVAEDNDYRTTHTLNRVARIMAAGHGGQILLSEEVADMVRRDLPMDITMADIGQHHMKGLTHPEHLFQLGAPDLPTAFPPLKTLDHHPTNLPLQPTGLIGREKEIASVCALLRHATIRLVTLTGPGGTGKTRLALQSGAELLDEFSDGVWFVNLAPISDPDLVASTIAQTLGVRETGSHPLRTSLQNYLREKDLLLLLDNFEQVVDMAPLVAELLAAASGLKVLVTSRVALHLSGEREIAVPPLGLPERTDLPPLERLTQYESVRLFIERAQAVNSAFQVTNANAPAVAEICHRLDGLPLAIELAAARTKLFPPQALLVRLGNRLKLLTGGTRDLPARHQTIRNAIDWSYNLLDAAQQTLFVRLGVFVGGWTEQAAEAVCNVAGDIPIDVLDGLAALLDHSLLRQAEGADGEPRFTMLETIREYALERLEQSAEADMIRQYHALYFCSAFHGYQADLAGDLPSAAVDKIAAEIDNIRAAWQWAIDHDDIACLQRALESLNLFYDMRGMATEGMSAFRRAIDRLSAGMAGEPTPERTLALGRLLVRQGWLLWRANLLGSSETIQRGLALLEAVDLDTRAERAYALGDLSWFYYISGDPEQAEACVTNGLTLARAVGADGPVASLLLTRAQILEFQGEARAAAEQFRASLAVYDNTDDLRGRASALNNWGRAAYAMGDYPQARRLIDEALHIRRGCDERYGISYSLLDLGRLAEFAGEYAQARDLIGQSLAVAEQVQSGDHLARVYVALGAVAHADGQLAKAEDCFQRALGFWRDLRVGRGPSLCLNGLAQIALDRGDIARARAYLEESLVIAQQLRNVGEAAGAELGLGCVALASGALSHAAAHLCQALKIAERTGAAPLALDTLIVVAQLETFGQSMRIERAIALFALVMAHPATRHVTRVRAAGFLDAVIGTLPPEAAQAAEAGGQARELWATAGELVAELETARWEAEEPE